MCLVSSVSNLSPVCLQVDLTSMDTILSSKGGLTALILHCIESTSMVTFPRDLGIGIFREEYVQQQYSGRLWDLTMLNW